MLRVTTVASEGVRRSQTSSRAFYLPTWALVILDPRPDRDARGPGQWPFHGARPGPQGPARVRGCRTREPPLSSANRPSQGLVERARSPRGPGQEWGLKAQPPPPRLPLPPPWLCRITAALQSPPGAEEARVQPATLGLLPCLLRRFLPRSHPCHERRPIT